MFAVFGHDNDITFFEGRSDVQRCPSCGQLLNKWDQDLSNVPLPRKLRLDFSTSYDGVEVATPRFRELYERSGLSGLTFRPLSQGVAYQVLATQTVEFDAVKRGVRFEKRCPTCGQFGAVAGAVPVYLVAQQVVPDLGFARTDVEFGSNDEKGPVLICGAGAASVLRAAKLKGLDLKPVAAD